METIGGLLHFLQLHFPIAPHGSRCSDPSGPVWDSVDGNSSSHVFCPSSFNGILRMAADLPQIPGNYGPPASR